MIKFVKRFCWSNSGAVTADWVVLTAAVVTLAATAYISIDEETNALSARVASTINGESGN